MNPLIRTLRRRFKGITDKVAEDVMLEYNISVELGILSHKEIWDAIFEKVRESHEEKPCKNNSVFSHIDLKKALDWQITVNKRRARMRARRKK